MIANLSLVGKLVTNTFFFWIRGWENVINLCINVVKLRFQISANTDIYHKYCFRL